MLSRCHKRSNRAYKRYGGRGIKVCDRWREDFKNFLADVGYRPSPKHSLDRIKNNQGYKPGNVRWATRSEQNNNRRGNRVLILNGMKMTAMQWSRRIGIKYSTLMKRLGRGWSAKRALTMQVQDHG